MKSLYSRYLSERTPNWHILETSKGFATYTFVDPETVYIQDIYVHPKYRHSNYSYKLANTIVFRAKEKGCTTLIGTVLHSAKGGQASKAMLEGYGMERTFEGPNFDVYTKQINNLGGAKSGL